MKSILLDIVALLTLAVVVVSCGPDKPPSRDEIPVVKKVVYNLEQAIAYRDRAAIDSIMSVDILDHDLSSDSLLSLVYGPTGDFPFVRLGDYEIIYGQEVALVDCYLQDSTENHDRPFKFYFKKDDDLWLLTNFEPGEPDTTTSW